MNDGGRFFLKLSSFLVSAYAALFLAGQAFEHGLPWRPVQDPRKRLLWDPGWDGSRIVLLGDSEFASFGVDGPDKVLSRQLAVFTGENVFPGALDGARRSDILAAVRCVTAEWPKGTTIFVDFVPTRFLFAEAGANYKTSFEHIVRTPPATFGDQVSNLLVFPLTNRLFLFRNAEAVKGYLLHVAHALAGRPAPPFFHNDLSRNRIWDQDGDFALKRYQVFEEKFGKARPAASFELVTELAEIGGRHGIRVVFVLTPLNVELIRRLARRVPAQRVMQALDDTHAELTAFLDRAGCLYIDLYSTVPSEGFADLVHTNEKGDGIMAVQMALWLAQHP